MGIKRTNYFTGQFLQQEDLQTEQTYHLEAQREHNRLLHTWGVAGGLLVTKVTGTARDVEISPGMAIDSTGKAIRIETKQTLTFTNTAPDTEYLITITYDEAQTDPSGELGTAGNTRVTETPTLAITSATPPSDPTTEIILASVTTDVGGDIDAALINNSVRTTAGVNFTTLETQNITIETADPTITNWPKIQGNYLNPGNDIDVTADSVNFSGNTTTTGAASAASLTTTGNATVGADVNATGAVNAASLTTTGAATIGTNLTVTGDLTVNGTTVTVNATNMEVEDNIILLNKYAAGPGPNTSGVEVYRGGTDPNAQILWDETQQKWMAGTSAGLFEIPIGPLSVSGNNVGIGTATPDSLLHVAGNMRVTGQLLGAATNSAGTDLRIFTGDTGAGTTSWTYDSPKSIITTIDYSSANFTQIPLIFTSLHGNAWHALVSVASTNETSTGANVAVGDPTGVYATTTYANTNNWHVQWIAIGV